MGCSHPDSAFFLFCPAGAVNASLTEAAQTLCNLMLVLHLDEAAGRACARLREARLPYSVRLSYSRSDASMIEIAEEVGYSSVSYFSTAFKKSFGETPNRYQQTNHREPRDS